MIPKLPDNIDAIVVFGGNDLNCPSGDYSPSLYNDGSLYYSSFNRRKEIILDGEDEDYHAKIYVSQKNNDGMYGKPQELGQQINRKGYHTANVSFSKDGRTMYFTRMKLEGSEIAVSELYRANKSEDGWGAAEYISDLNGDFRTKHPVEGELFGNKVLFFVSDRDGGYGGDDIYYATIRGDGFSTPVNLGAKINTNRDDITPFYKDGTLYFSSKGYPSLGGFDIFYATWDGSEWSTPANIGHNYNSSYDDTYFSFNESGSMGFLVSNRPDKDKRNLKGKTCCDDIYTVQIRDVVMDLITLVEDENGPLNGALVELIDESVDGGNISTKSNPTANNFSFLLDPDHNYMAKVTRDGYYPDSFTFNTVGILDDYTVKKTIVLKPMPNVEEETEIVTSNQPIRLSDIYYDFEDDKILPDAEPPLEYLSELMNQYSDMVIELSSHTDSRGLSKYNQDLSQRRAESARIWLLDAGIAPDRIVAKGYGESQILNRCVDGIRCPEEEHRLNRRTEFKIISGPTTIEIKKSIQLGTKKDEDKN
jgi:peptidoglycan-associated lipoprotein